MLLPTPAFDLLNAIAESKLLQGGRAVVPPLLTVELVSVKFVTQSVMPLSAVLWMLADRRDVPRVG
jgi:hypothetical protein